MPEIKLPNSKKGKNRRHERTSLQNNRFGHGISRSWNHPTLQDKIEGNDPEVQWIIDIKRDFNKELISLQQHLTWTKN
jgi:hypothetical protein